MSWELHIIVKSWVYPKDKKVKRLVRPILDWMMWSCVKGRNEDTRAKKRHDRGNHPISRVQILEKYGLKEQLENGQKHRGWQHLRLLQDLR